MKAVDLARAKFDKGRLLEWHYDYLKTMTCAEDGTYKKCSGGTPDVTFDFSGAGVGPDAVKDAGDSNALVFKKYDQFKCYDKANSGTAKTDGTDTDSKVHAAKDDHDTENGKIAGK